MRLPSSLFLLLLLTACGGPRYQMVYDFTPPTDDTGRQCLQGCYQDQKLCQLNCERGQAICMEEARVDAEHNYADMRLRYVEDLKDYNLMLDAYYAERDNYESHRHALEEERHIANKLCKAGGREARLFCDRSQKLKRELRSLRAPYKPSKPVEPSLETEVTRLQAACNKPCNCDAQYRSCYTSCGGVVKQRRVCIDNCDQEK